MNQGKAQEKIFANYFDIEINSDEGTEVTGRMHFERNKDVRKSPFPGGYHFEILKQDKSLFKIINQFD